MTSILATILAKTESKETFEQGPAAKCMAFAYYKECSLRDFPDEMIIAMAWRMDLTAFSAFKRVCKRINHAFSKEHGRHLHDWKMNFESIFYKQSLALMKENLDRILPDVDIFGLLEETGGAIAGRFVLQAVTQGKVQANSVDVFVAYTLYDDKEEGLSNGILNFHNQESLKTYTLNLSRKYFAAQLPYYHYKSIKDASSGQESEYGFLECVKYSNCLIKEQGPRGSSFTALPVRIFYSQVSYRCEMAAMVEEFEASFDRCWATSSQLTCKHLYEQIRRSGRMKYRLLRLRGSNSDQAVRGRKERKEKAMAEGFLLLANEPYYD